MQGNGRSYLFPFQRITLPVLPCAFCQNAPQFGLKAGDGMRRLFRYMSPAFPVLSFPVLRKHAALQTQFHARFRFDDADVFLALTVDSQSQLFQRLQNVRAFPDLSRCSPFPKVGQNGVSYLVAFSCPEFLSPSGQTRPEQISLFWQNLPASGRIIRAGPAFTPVEQVSKNIKVLLPAGRTGVKILSAGKLQTRNQKMQLMMPRMGMTNPENIALIFFKPGKGHMFKSVHHGIFLLLADAVIRMPCQYAGREFPSPLYAVDKRTGHGRIAAQYLRGACVSSRIIRAHKIAAGLVS